MRLLTIHSDFMGYKPLQKAIAKAEEVELVEKRIDDCLVIFVSVEKEDEDNPVAVADRAVAEIEGVAGKVSATRLVVYPWVHLTSNPSSPDAALSILKDIESKLKEKDRYEVTRAPFGYYKQFTIKCKGHPLSELSREIRAGELEKKPVKKEENVSESLKLEEKTKREFFILTPEGELVPPDKFDYTGMPNFKTFVKYETEKVRAYETEPPHIRIMKEHGIAQYEPGSDAGNFRWPPKGRLIKKLLEKAITDYCVDYGAMEVETPIMYDYEHPALKKYLNRFPARQYSVKSDDKEFFLRFAACFGQFLMTHDMVISYKDLPLKMFELTRYSFRREQSGELAGLKRLRAFTMPDMHTLCGNIQQAKDEFNSQYLKCYEWMTMLELDFETTFRAQKEFFQENREWYMGMIQKVGKPVLIELFDIRYAYFITKFEFNFVDLAGKASALSTVQIDVENSETYELGYTSREGKKEQFLILHTSISGSIERVIYALLEKEAKKIADKKVPMLPLWLSPTQVRVVPITDKHVKYADEIADQLELENIRCDIDNRTETLEKKIRDAEREWVPYILVVGDREMESKKFSVRVRESGERKTISMEELGVITRSRLKGKSFDKLSLSRYLSKRPII
ncbi:MAG: Threonyl-tRNA synthetase [Candidatus Fermentimicrarchaeum limneticum]|uniref:Threonine--tRNA ligase n=1 Tax=Fermentimicrarchaeum limneticum TaxID=2795018 RepID=A0A7D6BQ45_FERL1|nr:MAG: Threonyl-tRNA synthetase [Candidatus Fermentimicrarchaeum limneticum]